MGILYRLCEGLLARLPVDESGRRVFDETLADWRRDPRSIPGGISAARAVVGVAYRETVSSSMRRTWIHVTAWSAAWMLTALCLGSLFSGYWNVSAYKIAAWSVSGLVFFFPTAILLTAVTRKGRLPVLGFCLTSALAGLLLIGWASPAANRVALGNLIDVPLVKQAPLTVAQARFQAAWPPLPLEHMSGLYAHDLPQLVVDGPPKGWSGIYFTSFNSAFVVLCLLTPLAASRPGRRTWSRRLGITCALLFVLYRGRVADFVAPDWVLWSFVAPWLPVVAMTVVLFVCRTAAAEAKASASIQ